MTPIRIAIAGVGNCASALLQGLQYYGTSPPANGRSLPGLLHARVGSYTAADITVVAAFDIDARKVGKPLEVACAAPPNCTTQFLKRFPRYGVRVQMGPVLDGVAPHMRQYPASQTFIVSKARPVNIAKVLKQFGVEILLNYLPVGSQRATEAYAAACLETGASLINCIPVFIASDRRWAARFAKRGIPIVGDDVKGPIGATILHRTLARLFMDRGASIERTYQLNVGGNTDFLNMLNQDRLKLKKISKTEAVQSALSKRLDNANIHIGPSDYVPWQRDRKVSFLRIEGRGGPLRGGPSLASASSSSSSAASSASPRSPGSNCRGGGSSDGASPSRRSSASGSASGNLNGALFAPTACLATRAGDASCSSVSCLGLGCWGSCW